MAESPEEKEALGKLDAEVDDVVWNEFDKEGRREEREPFFNLFGVSWGPLATERRRLLRRAVLQRLRRERA